MTSKKQEIDTQGVKEEAAVPTADQNEVASEVDDFDVNKELDKLINPIQKEIKPVQPNKRKKRSTESYTVQGNSLCQTIVEAFIEKGFNKDYAQSRLSESINNYQYITYLGRVFVEALKKLCQFLSSIWRKNIKVKDLGLDVLIKQLTHYELWMNQRQRSIFHKVLEIAVELHQHLISEEEILTLYRRLDAQNKIYKSKTGPFASYKRRMAEKETEQKNNQIKKIKGRKSEVKKYLHEKRNFKKNLQKQTISGNDENQWESRYYKKIRKSPGTPSLLPYFSIYQHQSIAAFYKQPVLIADFLSKQYPYITWTPQNIKLAIKETIKTGIMQIANKSQQGRYLRRELPCLVLTSTQMSSLLKDSLPSHIEYNIMNVVLHGLETDVAVRDRVLEMRKFLKQVQSHQEQEFNE